MLVLGLQAGGTLVAAPPLLHALGATGAGVAWAGTQFVLAAGMLILLAFGRRPSRRAVVGAARRHVGDRPLRRMRTDSRSSVLLAGPREAPELVVKLAGSPRAAERLAAHGDAVRRLRALPLADGFRALLPEATDAGDGWLVERALPGVDGRRLDPDRVLAAAAAAIAPLYAATATAGDAGAWLDRRAEPLARVAGPAARAVVERLREQLADQDLAGGWTHGDLWPGNLLLTPDAAVVTGIADWEAAEPDGLPAADLAHLVVCVRAQRTGRGLGTVAGRLAGGRDTLAETERAALATCGVALPGALIGQLGWMQHVALRAGQVSPRPHGLWAQRTLRPVLREVHA
jgi:hypothetical protein